MSRDPHVVRRWGGTDPSERLQAGISRRQAFGDGGQNVPLKDAPPPSADKIGAAVTARSSSSDIHT